MSETNKKDRLGLVAVGGEALIAILLAITCAAVITWPALMNINEVVIGGGELGGWLWRYWWHFMEIDALSLSDANLWTSFEAMISLGRYPETGNILDVLLLSYPLQIFSGLPTHYNLKIFIILGINGLCGYALARTFVASRSACLVASVFAVVNPIVIQDLYGSGLRQVLLWWVLLFPALLHRANRIGSPMSGAIAGIILGLTAAFYWFYGIFSAIFCLIWIIGYFWSNRADVQWRRLFRWGIPLVAAATVVAALFFIPYMSAPGGSRAGAGAALPELSFFLPFPDYDVIKQAPLRPSTYAENVLASLNRTILSSWSPDYIVNPGHPRPMPVFVFLAGILPAIWKFRKSTVARFWLITFTVFYLGTLGPYMKEMGSSDTTNVLTIWGDIVIRLPFTIMFQWVPGMSRMFAPYRLGAFVVVASVVLVALGVSLIRDSERFGSWPRRLVSLSIVIGTLMVTNFRWEIGPVPDDAIAPTRWRAPVKVSVMQVPEFYQSLDKEEEAGLIELPLEQQQDLIYYYQLTHNWKVYRSWATPPAIPPLFRSEGGGTAGARMRYLARPDSIGVQAGDLLLRLSKNPQEVSLDEVDDTELAHLFLGGNYRYLIVHERGYFLMDPMQGQVVYSDVVRRLERRLGIEATNLVEHEWFDYPGNEFKVPDGPVYLPWTSQQVALPDRERPSQYFMAIFDLSEFLEGWDGPPVPEQPDSEGALNDEQAATTEHVHEERVHINVPPPNQSE